MKCDRCGKKISLVEREYCKCKCGKTFCSTHRYSDTVDSVRSHKCTFDYFGDNKEHVKKILTKPEDNKIIRV